MRKLFLGFSMLLISQFGFGQAVSDNAVIPVSVTLNSILRLTVTSGGNIQFVVTTMNHYTAGIANSAQYITTFNVSSSRAYTVDMTPDVATGFTGLETGNATDFLNQNIGYDMGGTGAGAVTPGTLRELADVLTNIVTAPAGGNQVYEIQWELATPALVLLNGLGSLLSQSLPADVYVQNIFLTLAPQ